ncbi:MAG: DUF72 domain-containing protein [Endomicrobiales bacterium]|nr:DUF72 domain-containing protein [Endomicrobiales bacterium]
MKTVTVGCCGFPVSQKKYYNLFSSIEINQTFYQLPELKTAQRWHEEAPKDFNFIIKAWQLITHPANSLTYRRLRQDIPQSKKKFYGNFQPTDEVKEAWRRTLEFGRILKAKVYLFQSPYSFRPSLENITNIVKFFKSIPRDGLTFIWEPRGTWPDEIVVKLCKDLHLVHCTDPTRSKALYGHIRYYRMHGNYEGKQIVYDYEYTSKELINILSKLDKPFNYVFFNNSAMWNNAIQFQKLINK